MDPEQYEEWYLLRDQVTEMLRAGSLAHLTKSRQLFQILVLPAFEPYLRWELAQADDRSGITTYFALKTVWRADIDSDKLSSPVERLRHPRPLVPTLERKQFSLESAFALSALERLRRITVPAFVESNQIGLDGISYELAYDAGYVRARYHWWLEPPEPWRPLGQFVLEMLESLERFEMQSPD